MSENTVANMSSFFHNRWPQQKMILSLPAYSAVVLHIAAYCRVHTDRSPTANSRKGLLKEWLDADDATKIKLHELIKLSTPKFRIFHVDGILAEHGHVCSHLPPYHPELNATEKIWTIVKNWVAARM